MCLTGCYCKKCTKVNRNETLKKTCLEKYGVENISKLQDTKTKKRQSSIKNYGVNCVLQSQEINVNSRTLFVIIIK